MLNVISEAFAGEGICGRESSGIVSCLLLLMSTEPRILRLILETAKEKEMI